MIIPDVAKLGVTLPPPNPAVTLLTGTDPSKQKQSTPGESPE
jgi:hypothetical protein